MLIQIGIKLVPVSDTEHLQLRSVGFDFCKITSGCKDTSCVSPCVPLPGQKLIFFPVGQAALPQICRARGEVSSHREKPFAIRASQHGLDTVRSTSAAA